jgi:serine/threonine-protein kinase
VRFHDRYLIVRCINAGAMGAVYEVLDERTNSRRALKVMLPETIRSDDLRSRFAQEAKITGCVESDHIIRVVDADVDARSGMPFIVMELLRGDDLGSILKQRGALSPEEVLTYFNQIALALEKTHAAGIIHRDLKPDNLFLTARDDGSPCVKILDFGIAKVVANTNEGGSTRPIGTPFYMSPEQIRGDASLGPATDLYALGHIAFTLLVGKPYWYEEGQSSQESVFTIVAKIISGSQEPPSNRARRYGRTLLPAFDAWFLKITRPVPSARYDSAKEAVAALSYALSTSARPSLSSAPFDTLGARAAGSTILDDSGSLSAISDLRRSLDGKRPRSRTMSYVALIAAAVVGSFVLALVFSSWSASDRAVVASSALDPLPSLLSALDSGPRRASEISAPVPSTGDVSPPEAPLEVAPSGAAPSPGASATILTEAKPPKRSIEPASVHRSQPGAPPAATSTSRKRSIF